MVKLVPHKFHWEIGKIGILIVDLEANFYVRSGFGGVCGVICAKTWGSHNKRNFYPNGARKEVSYAFLGLLKLME